MERYSDQLIALGRLLICILFIWDAIFLLGSPKDSIGYISSSNLPFPTLAYAGAVAIELAGGIALLVGFKTRWAAAALALFCLVTAAFFHTGWADIDTKIHFFKNLAMAGGLLQLMARGGGALSLDGRMARA